MPPEDQRPYEVIPFTNEGFTQLLADLSGTSLDSVQKKSHQGYFLEYFEEFRAATIIVERLYIDHDYLEDYAAYYAKCFHRYERFCSRLHFFNLAITHNQFEDLLRASNGHLDPQKLADGYLGFMVIKPLPDTFIGRTCLRTYPQNGHRFYPTTRTHDAHLFGLTLSVEAVAFQEQDNTVAMCATSALWAAFQGTGKLFHHPILSPVEITKAATLNSDDAMRSLPNNGLNLEQMARAIRSVSLEPFFFDAHDPYILKSTVYAYLKGHIPVLLDVALVDVGPLVKDEDLQDLSKPSDSSPTLAISPETEPQSMTGSETAASNDENPPKNHLRGEKIGEHEVAIVGYGLGGQLEPLSETGLLLTATRIDKLYVHDDQVGPYARMIINEKGHLSTSWPCDITHEIGRVWAAPGNALIPLYNKVRIPFDVIHDKVIVPLDQFLEDARAENVLPFSERLEWDIYLTSINQLKSDIMSEPNISGVYRENILCMPLPRYLWRATALYDGHKVFDLLFDATDIETGSLFLSAIEYDGDFSRFIREVANDEGYKFELSGDRLGFILNWFTSHSIDE